MKKVLSYIGILLVLVLLFLFFWPVPLQPNAWHPPAATGHTGDYAPNQALASALTYPTTGGYGPEDVALDSAGAIYAGLANGKILRWAEEGSEAEVFAQTGGRPLGLDFDSTGNLIVADAVKGLLSVSSTGSIKVLTNGANDQLFGFTNDLEVGADGTIYFSDASARHGVVNYRNILLEHEYSGQLLAYDPINGQTEMLLDSLCFANGVAVSPDQSFVLVNETASYRVIRYWLKGPKKGTHEYLIENLPGFPDGISSTTRGTYWIALINPRNALLDKFLPYPFMLKFVYRLPLWLQPAPVRYGMVIEIDQDGKVLRTLQDPTGRIAWLTSAQEEEGKLYLGSLDDPVFTVLDLEE